MKPGISHPPPQLFVGRRAELAMLAEALDAALAGRGSLTVMSGEAGIGKSALVEQHHRPQSRTAWFKDSEGNGLMVREILPARRRPRSNCSLNSAHQPRIKT